MEPATAAGAPAWPAAQGAVRYLYAVCRGLDMRAIDGAVGLSGMPLEPVHHDDLIAVVSSVPQADFGAEPLRGHLTDLPWLEDAVTTHTAVISAAAATAATVPLRLATVCEDDAAVRRWLREWRIPLTWALDRVEGCAEWRVRMVVPEGGGAADQLIRPLHDGLSRLAVAHRELPAEDARLSGHSGVLALNAAYLVSSKDGDVFAGQLAELVAGLAGDVPGVVVDGRGPQPPYAFAMLEQR